MWHEGCNQELVPFAKGSGFENLHASVSSTDALANIQTLNGRLLDDKTATAFESLPEWAKAHLLTDRHLDKLRRRTLMQLRDLGELGSSGSLLTHALTPLSQSQSLNCFNLFILIHCLWRLVLVAVILCFFFVLRSRRGDQV